MRRSRLYLTGRHYDLSYNLTLQADYVGAGAPKQDVTFRYVAVRQRFAMPALGEQWAVTPEFGLLDPYQTRSLAVSSAALLFPARSQTWRRSFSRDLSARVHVDLPQSRHGCRHRAERRIQARMAMVYSR